MFNTAAATSHASSACDRPILHHSHSDSNCHRLYHQQKRFQKRHSATSFGPTSTTRWSLQPQPQEVLCKSFPNPSYSASPSTAHGIFHEHDHYTTNHHQHHYRHHQQHVWAGATGSGSGPPKTRGLFRRVTRKVIEWIRGSIVPGAKQTSNNDPDQVQLDDEMEKVFGSVGTDKEKFELKRLNDDVLVDQSPLKYEETSRPATTSLRPMDTSGASGANNGSSLPSTTPTSPISVSSKSESAAPKPSNDTTLADNSSNDFSEAVHDDPPPVVDQGSTLQGEQWDNSARRNVRFDSQDQPAQFVGLQIEDTNEERRRRTERHHPHKSRKFSLQEYHPEWRRQSGAEGASTGTRRVSVQPEDATLQEADIDELTSHRSDDPRALRRHKVSAQSASGVSASVVSTNRKDNDKLDQLLSSSKCKKLYDHSPHEVFVQLDELTGTGEEREWKETARWIKYEEDVEEGADRWGRPHVASLSFHSLLNLRRCLETGVVLMDLDEKDLPSVAYRIVEQMVTDELIHEDDKPVIMRALLLRHRHVNEHSHGGFHFGPKRKYSSYSSLQSLSLRGGGEDGSSGGLGTTEVIVGVRRLNSFVSPTQSYTLSPPSLHPNYSPNGHHHHHQQHHQQSKRQHSNGHHNNHHRQRTESPEQPVATVAGGMRRNNSPPSLTVSGENSRRSSTFDFSRRPSIFDFSRRPSMFDFSRRSSTFNVIDRLRASFSESVDDKKPRIVPSSEINGHGETKINMQEETYTSSQEDIKMRIQKESILKRIPEGAEATTVLVGSVDFLEQPTIAFVRLAEGIPMPSITEVPIPVRFLFILLGPKTAELDYHEVGRSIATLMSNEHFHDIAYRADDRKDLLSAINEFLDDSIVLPPGKWERQALLPFDELRAKSDMIRNRKKKAIDEKIKSKQPLMTSEEEKKLLAASDGDGKKPPKNPLEKTNRLWGGLFNDIKRRYPMYMSDIKDGLNAETLAATIFMYFAALSTAITFGGLASDKTHNLIGISETLVSCAFVGLIFHTLAGQPLVIIGTTGPLLLFDEALNQFCIANNYSFLTVRVYIGMWLTIIALTVSAFEGSVYVRLFTRFTQEIFSALITLIYIVETAMKLIYVYGRNPLLAEYRYKNMTVMPQPLLEPDTNSTLDSSVGLLAESLTAISNATTAAVATLNDDDNLLIPADALGPKNQPNTALFCTLLTLGTFSLAYYLRLFRNSHFLGRNARRALGDFGVPISIAIFVGIDYMLPQVFTEKLSVPEGISPSDESRRGWVIPMDGLPSWMPFVAGIPALLVYILIFMETHISELIVDKPERGLKKGSGLHMDIVLLCFLNTVCGFFGMPWHCAATVRSVTHVSAVTIMSKTHAPGESPHITDVKEQRISGFFVSLMVGLSVTMAPILRLIPMSVLFGVFLYMGIASMSGVQFFDRLRLFFMPVKHHPQVPFVRRVPTWKMHVFTFVQVLALAMLWTVKSSSFSLAFPFFLIMMVPIRKQMERIFTPLELRALDGSQPNEGAEDEPDFYEQAPIPA